MSDSILDVPTQSPSYDALLIIAQSVCGALARAGMTDCDDPGEAIDVIRERLEAALDALKLLLHEVDESAIAGANDYGWPIAVQKSRAVLDSAQAGLKVGP